MTQSGEIRSEFSAPRIPFEDFVKRPEWSSLPFLIQLAVLHLRRAELQSVQALSPPTEQHHAP